MPRIWQTWRERRQQPEAAARRAQLISDYRVTFGGEPGQRVLADICHRGGIMQTSFRAGSPDLTAYQEGRRRLALEIIETINADPTAAERLAVNGNTEDVFNV